MTETSGGGARHGPSAGARDDADLERAGLRVEDLLAQVGAMDDAAVRDRVEGLVADLLGLYGAALGRLITHATESGAVRGELEGRMARDPLLSSLLLVHGLHPEGSVARIEHALDGLRPSLRRRGAMVELLGVEPEGVARLRLAGTGSPCGASMIGAERAIRRAVEEAAPEVTRIEVQAGTVDPDGLVKLGRKALRARVGPPSPSRATPPREPASSRRVVTPECELCGVPIAEAHRHVVDLEHRSLCCACPACASLLADPRAIQGRYCTVPDRVLVDPGFTLDEAKWATLGVPVRLSFFFFSSAIDAWVAVHPSPAGPVESELSNEAWQAVAGDSRLVAALAPDVEALLAHRPMGARRTECFLAPIDTCYALVARVRQSFTGMTGGEPARREIAAFFDELRRKSRPLGEASGGER